MRAKVRVATSTFVALSMIPVTDQNVNRGDIRSKKHDCLNAPLFQGGYHHQIHKPRVRMTPRLLRDCLR